METSYFFPFNQQNIHARKGIQSEETVKQLRLRAYRNMSHQGKMKNKYRLFPALWNCR